MPTRIPAFVIHFSFLATLILALPPCGASASTPADASRIRAATQYQAQAFNFLYGTWKVHNRFLSKRLANSHDWVEFEATDKESPLPGGIGNEEHYRTEHWKDFVGLGLRLYNPVTRQWSIYWSDNRFSTGYFQNPVKGSFVNGVGVFEGPDTFNGKPITVRYTWAILGKSKARWEQAFSRDNGKTWETNW